MLKSLVACVNKTLGQVSAPKRESASLVMDSSAITTHLRRLIDDVLAYEQASFSKEIVPPFMRFGFKGCTEL